MAESVTLKGSEVKKSLVSLGLVFFIPFFLIGLWVFFNLRAPIHQDNLCQLFQDHPGWYFHARQAEKKWGVPVSVQMAIIHRESHFRADAKPPHRWVLGFIPWRRVSTAEGYMQATNSTWQWYLKEQHLKSASRSNFTNAVDFIGWYTHHAHQSNAIAMNDAYHLYLAYYLGLGAYHSHAYADNTWLLNTATGVQEQANRYHRQLMSCSHELPSKPWWLFWS